MCFSYNIVSVLYCYHVFYIHIATQEELMSAEQTVKQKQREVDNLTLSNQGKTFSNT